MIYVLDADVFIRAWRDNYPFQFFPSWWRWLGNLLASCKAVVPEDVYNEIQYPDDLKKWLRQVCSKTSGCVIRRSQIPTQNQQVVAETVRDRYDDVFAQEFFQKADYWLICSAFFRSGVVASLERRNRPSQSSGSKWRAEVKVPNVCSLLNIRCIGNFPDLFKEIGGLRL